MAAEPNGGSLFSNKRIRKKYEWQRNPIQPICGKGDRPVPISDPEEFL
jgi:hypothetical protein